MEEIWADIAALPARDLLWSFAGFCAAFAAEFAVKRSLFPRIGIDRRWAYAFGVSTGFVGAGMAAPPPLGWIFVLSFFILLPGIIIYSKRFRKSEIYMKSYFGSLSQEPGIYSIPVLGFVISCVELFSFSKYSRKIFYKGEIGPDSPDAAMIYGLVLFGLCVVLYFAIVFLSELV